MFTCKYTERAESTLCFTTATDLGAIPAAARAIIERFAVKEAVSTAIHGYRRRCRAHGISGAMCSDWGATAPVYLQRNHIYMAMAYNDRIFCDEDYEDTDDRQFAACIDDCFVQLYTYHYGTQSTDAYIPLLRTTTRTTRYTEFVDGIYTEGEAYRAAYYLGHYLITYTDGATAQQDIFSGEHLGADSYPWYGEEMDAESTDAAPRSAYGAS